MSLEYTLQSLNHLCFILIYDFLYVLRKILQVGNLLPDDLPSPSKLLYWHNWAFSGTEDACSSEKKKLN